MTVFIAPGAAPLNRPEDHAAPGHAVGGAVGASDGAFSAVLREATKDLHRQAERSGFIADLLHGRTTQARYALYLRNLLPAYAALEQALDRGPHTLLLAPFADRRLRRLPALTADLLAIAGPDWRDTHTLLPEAKSYAGLIERAGRGDGYALLAHAYARYLGDLSGGQILKSLLSRFYGLGPATLAFYDFPALSDQGAAKIAMRRALHDVPFAGHAAETVIVAAKDAFRHIIALSEAIGAASLHRSS